MADYPCKTCTRVKDPKKCENKVCREWQAWFIQKWDELRKGWGTNGNDPI